MPYRLVAFDIDGTIRSNNYPMSKRTRAVIDKIESRGTAVTLVTGRTFKSAVKATNSLKLTSPIITFQGAHIADPQTGDTLWHKRLSTDMTLSALDALKIWDQEILAYLGNEVYANKMTPWVLSYGKRNNGDVRVSPDLRSLASKGLTRLVAVGKCRKVSSLVEEMKAGFSSSLKITRSLPYFCEILHPASGKDKALAWLCQYLDITQNETIAFGNGYNDVDMLRWAELGVAVADSVPEILDVANLIAPPLEEDGPAQILERLLMEGLL